MVGVAGSIQCGRSNGAANANNIECRMCLAIYVYGRDLLGGLPIEQPLLGRSARCLSGWASCEAFALRTRYGQSWHVACGNQGVWQKVGKSSCILLYMQLFLGTKMMQDVQAWIFVQWSCSIVVHRGKSGGTVSITSYGLLLVLQVEFDQHWSALHESASCDVAKGCSSEDQQGMSCVSDFPNAKALCFAPCTHLLHVHV